MVRTFLLFVVLASLACHVLAQVDRTCYTCSTQKECDQACRKCGSDPQGVCTYMKKGKCQQCAHCTGKGDSYENPGEGPPRLCCENSGESFQYNKTLNDGGMCCKKGETLLVDAESDDGKCCDENHHPLYDATSGDGFCCPVDTDQYENGECKKSGKKHDDPDDDPDDDDHHCGDKVCPKNHHDLGLEYGSCYRIKDLKGRVLSRRYGGDDYLWDTAYAPIAQFQVCKTTSDCQSTGHVHASDPFYLRDELGHPADTKDQDWWIGQGPHYSETNNAKLAKKFSARFYCGKKCGICLKGFDYGVSVVCPAENSGLGTYQNPHYCYPVTLEKVPCLEDLEDA